MTEPNRATVEMPEPAVATAPIRGRLTGDHTCTIALALYADDPFAVSMVIDQGPDSDAVLWKFDRDLLAAAFDPRGAGAAGYEHGDIRILVDEHGVTFWFEGPDGSKPLSTPAAPIVEFLANMNDRLPHTMAAAIRRDALDEFLTDLCGAA